MVHASLSFAPFEKNIFSGGGICRRQFGLVLRELCLGFDVNVVDSDTVCKVGRHVLTECSFNNAWLARINPYDRQILRVVRPEHLDTSLVVVLVLVEPGDLALLTVLNEHDLEDLRVILSL